MRHLPRRAVAGDLSARLVCQSCRLQRRQFATAPSPGIPPASGIAQLSSRRLISITGADSAKFLQGIITASVTSKDGLPRQDAFYTAFLTATGRILYDVFIYPNHGAGASADETGFLIEVDADQAAALAKHIKRYKLRAKLAVRLLGEDEGSVWHGWDNAETSKWDALAASTRHTFKDPRVPGLGYRSVRLGQAVPEIDVERTTEDAYTIRRILHGVPEGQGEMPKEHSLPQESNIDMMNGIEWKKGCYVGQELTIRTKHRGVVRKRVLPCVIYEPEHGPPAALEYRPGSALLETTTAEQIPRGTSIGRFGKRGRSAGRWLNGVGNVGLGLCRLEIMTDVTLPGETAAATYSPEDEFKLEWGEDEDEGGSRNAVKVKAFVPDWLRQALDASQKH